MTSVDITADTTKAGSESSLPGDPVATGESASPIASGGFAQALAEYADDGSRSPVTDSRGDGSPSGDGDPELSDSSSSPPSSSSSVEPDDGLDTIGPVASAAGGDAISSGIAISLTAIVEAGVLGDKTGVIESQPSDSQVALPWSGSTDGLPAGQNRVESALPAGAHTSGLGRAGVEVSTEPGEPSATVASLKGNSGVGQHLAVATSKVAVPPGQLPPEVSAPQPPAVEGSAQTDLPNLPSGLVQAGSTGPPQLVTPPENPGSVVERVSATTVATVPPEAVGGRRPVATGHTVPAEGTDQPVDDVSEPPLGREPKGAKSPAIQTGPPQLISDNEGDTTDGGGQHGKTAAKGGGSIPHLEPTVSEATPTGASSPTAVLLGMTSHETGGAVPSVGLSVSGSSGGSPLRPEVVGSTTTSAAEAGKGLPSEPAESPIREKSSRPARTGADPQPSAPERTGTPTVENTTVDQQTTLGRILRIGVASAKNDVVTPKGPGSHQTLPLLVDLPAAAGEVTEPAFFSLAPGASPEGETTSLPVQIGLGRADVRRYEEISRLLDTAGDGAAARTASASAVAVTAVEALPEWTGATARGSATHNLMSHLSDLDQLELPDQLVRAIRMQWRNGVGEAKLRLTPDHLGEVMVSLSVRQGSVSAVLSADSDVVRQWIRLHQSELRASLAAQGLQLEELVVDEERHADQQPGQQLDRERRRPARPISEGVRFEVRV